MDWNDFIGKKVFLRTKHEMVYSGIIEDIIDDNDLIFIKLRDKFDKIVLFVSSEIVQIKEED